MCNAGLPQHQAAPLWQPGSRRSCCTARRVVRTDITQPGPPQWQDVIPQHPKDLLQWAVLLKGGLMAVCWLHDVQARGAVAVAVAGSLLFLP